MSDRSLEQLVAEAQLLKTKEARQAWTESLSDHEREVFTKFANELISNLNAIWQRLSNTVLDIAKEVSR